MELHSFQPGDKSFLAEDSPGGRFSAVFEDEGETGYFYAVDISKADQIILDAVHIYNAANIRDRARKSTLEIVWSEDGLNCALLINGFAHAAFDFTAKRGFCRTNFPNFPDDEERPWPRSDHSWSDDEIGWL
jgi:hypothetical protein